MRKGLEVTIPSDLSRAGSVELLSARLTSGDSPFAVVNYAIRGKKQELGLRLDLDKQVFLDKVGNPKVDRVLRKRATDVVNVVGKRQRPFAKGQLGRVRVCETA